MTIRFRRWPGAVGSTENAFKYDTPECQEILQMIEICRVVNLDPAPEALRFADEMCGFDASFDVAQI